MGGLHWTRGVRNSCNAFSFDTQAPLSLYCPSIRGNSGWSKSLQEIIRSKVWDSVPHQRSPLKAKRNFPPSFFPGFKSSYAVSGTDVL